MRLSRTALLVFPKALSFFFFPDKMYYCVLDVALFLIAGNYSRLYPVRRTKVGLMYLVDVIRWKDSASLLWENHAPLPPRPLLSFASPHRPSVCLSVRPSLFASAVTMDSRRLYSPTPTSMATHLTSIRLAPASTRGVAGRVSQTCLVGKCGDPFPSCLGRTGGVM